MSSGSASSPAPLAPAAQARWPVAVSGVAMQIMLGTVYAWSVFKKPLMARHVQWQEWEVGLTFTLMIFFLGFAAALGGRLVDRAGARVVATVAGLMFGVGTLLAGVADQIDSKWLLWLGYGVLGGIGNGLAYITPVAVLVRWFPDKKGTITGLAVMGFGLGAALMTVAAGALLPSVGTCGTFYLVGAVLVIGVPFAARRLANPPGWSSAAAAGSTTTDPSIDAPTAVGMYQFYVLWGLLFLNVCAGIALVSNLSPMAQQQLGISETLAGGIVLASSFFNGFGRLFWAWLSERIGRKRVFLVLIATQIPLFLLLPRVTDYWLFAVMACYILLCYGGGFGTMPSFTADTFGPRHIGNIYGKILFAWGLAGVVGPLLMEWVKKATGQFTNAMYVAAGLLAAGFLLGLTYHKPARRS